MKILSTAQVQKGVYKKSLQSWKQSERNLYPLLQLAAGSDTEHEFDKTLKEFVG